MMSKGPRRRFTTEFKQQAVARLSMTCATQAGVAQELGITSSQLKAWRLELEAAGSVEAVRRRKAEAAELAELRRENRRLKEEVEVMRQASAFFAQWAARQGTRSSPSSPPMSRSTPSASCAGFRP